MTDDVCKGYCEYMDKNRIHYIYGYAAAIYMFADYVRRTGALRGNRLYTEHQF